MTESHSYNLAPLIKTSLVQRKGKAADSLVRQLISCPLFRAILIYISFSETGKHI